MNTALLLTIAESSSSEISDVSDISESAAESSDLLHELAEHPGDFSALGKFLQNLGSAMLSAIPTILFALLV
ncbi:MAG: hypothetical protein K2N56_01575, partial [Oscillospiraceae bacterium]|nr:hypothetical protein [Oscillospiraceae bacterium]